MRNLEKTSRDRAQRLRKIRAMAGLTRKAMAQKYHIPPGTLQNWEMPRFGGLSERGAYQVIQSLTMEGVYASFEWLMMGVGPGPTMAPHSQASGITESVECSQKKIAKEIEYFQKKDKRRLVFTLNDDSMQPGFAPGDVFVGQQRVSSRDMISLINRLCIIQIDQHVTLLRYVKAIQPRQKTLVLFAQHPNSDCRHAATQSPFKAIWQVVWIRQVSQAASPS